MPIFEIETPDGLFEVDAPDEQTALSSLNLDQPKASAPNENPTSDRDKFYSSGIYAGEHNPLGSIARTIDAGARGIQSGVTFGFDDEMGLADREEKKAIREESPIASTVGDIAGGLGFGGVAAKGGLSLLQGAKPTLGSLFGRGAAEGAIYGGAYGAGDGEGAKDRVNRALFGAVTGGVIGGGSGALASIGARSVTSKAAPSVDALKDASEQAYKAADKAGVIFDKAGMNKLKTDIVDSLRSRGATPENNPEVWSFLKAYQRDASGNVTFKGLDTLRKTASNGVSGAKDSTKAMLTDIIAKIDDFIDNPQNMNVMTGDKGAAAKAIKEARGLWSRAKKTELVQDAFLKAERNAASAGSGGNVENAARQQIKSILNNPKKSRGFTPAEIAAMEQFVRGTKGQNLARLVGKLSPQGNGLMAALGVGATAANPLMAAVPAAGLVAKKVADKGSVANREILEALIRNGGKSAVPQLSAGRKAIADALMRSGIAVAP